MHRSYDCVLCVSQAVPIGTLPVAIQEVAVVDDILYTMSGVEGKYIRITRDPLHRARGHNVGQAPAFDIDSTLDPSLKSLVERIMPICVYYSNIARLTDGKGTGDHQSVQHRMQSQYMGLDPCVVPHVPRDC